MLFLLGPIAANADVALIKMLRPGRVEHDNSGDYDRALTAILKESSMTVSVRAEPLKRSNRSLLLQDDICKTPTDLTNFLRNTPGAKRENYISSVPIDLISGHILSRPGEPAVRDKSTLIGKNIAVWWGVIVDEYVTGNGAKAVIVSSEDEAIQMLMAGRVDLAWGWLPDSPMHYEKIGYPAPNFDPDFSLLATPATIVCKRSDRTLAFIEEVNTIIEAMRSDGRLKKLFSPHARIVGVDVPMTKATVTQ